MSEGKIKGDHRYQDRYLKVWCYAPFLVPFGRVECWSPWNDSYQDRFSRLEVFFWSQDFLTHWPPVKRCKDVKVSKIHGYNDAFTPTSQQKTLTALDTLSLWMRNHSQACAFFKRQRPELDCFHNRLQNSSMWQVSIHVDIGIDLVECPFSQSHP